MFKKYFFPSLLLIASCYLVFNFFYDKYQIGKLHYGVKANKLRQTLFIPIIDSYMKATDPYDRFFGNRWVSKRDLPSGEEILHVWKSVTPLTDTAGLFEEMDGYRKKHTDNLYYQLNVNSKILGDTLATRTGKLFFYKASNQLNIDLNDEQIDSVASSWNLSQLVRKQ